MVVALVFGVLAGAVLSSPVASAATVVNGCTIVPNPTPTSRTNCPNKNLSGANLSGLDLRFANFSGSNLKGANLANSNLTQANLRNVNLKDAHLGGTILVGANVSGANLKAFFVATAMPNGSINSVGSTITVSPSTATIPNGLTQAFAAIGHYKDGASVQLANNVTWSSSNSQVAIVSPAGVATGVVPNVPYNLANFPKNATITAAAGSASGTATLTVGPPNLVGVAVTPANPATVLGNTQQFNATGTYSDASTTPLSGVVWSSDTPSVALVDNAGLALGVANGTATITAASGAISGSTTLSVVDALTITTASPLPVAVQGSAYSETLAATGGVGPFTWSLVSGSLPPGLTLHANGAITGTPTSAGTYNFVARIDDSGPPAQFDTEAFQVVVNPELDISTTSLSGGVVSSSYSQTLNAVGGIGPYTWSITQGNLPGGLTLNASTGVIAGTPTGEGTSNFTVQVTDSQSPADSDSKQLSIVVASLLSPVFTAGQPGIVGQPISPFTPVTATGGTTPYTFSITTGTLPPGLNLNTSTGQVSGTPTTEGSFSATVQLADSGSPAQTASTTVQIDVIGPLSITTTSLPNGNVVFPLQCGLTNPCYSATLTGAGGGGPPYVWGIDAGSLPPGLALNDTTGVISGDPSTAGTFPFTVELSKIGSPVPAVTKALSITILPPPPQIGAALLNDAVLNTPFSTGPLSVTGGTPPYGSWTITQGSLPTGLNLNSSTGVISGTPTVPGASTFTLQVTDSGSPAQSATKSVTIDVVEPLNIAGNLPVGYVGGPYGPINSFTATGGTSPYLFSVASGSLPPGLSMNSGGTVIGTPTTVGTFTFTVQVTDLSSPNQLATKQTSVQIVNVPPPTNPLRANMPVPSGSLFASYSSTMTATGGFPPYTWSATGLPPGLSLNSSTGVLSGNPTNAGTFPIVITVDDTGGQFVRTWTNITIYPFLCLLCSG